MEASPDPETEDFAVSRDSPAFSGQSVSQSALEDTVQAPRADTLAEFVPNSEVTVFAFRVRVAGATGSSLPPLSPPQDTAPASSAPRSTAGRIRRMNLSVFKTGWFYSRVREIDLIRT